jgi:hypothetical protein
MQHQKDVLLEVHPPVHLLQKATALPQLLLACAFSILAGAGSAPEHALLAILLITARRITRAGQRVAERLTLRAQRWHWTRDPTAHMLASVQQHGATSERVRAELRLRNFVGSTSASIGIDRAASQQVINHRNARRSIAKATGHVAVIACKACRA